jgi:PAS domain S-box-containing protein
MVLSGTFPAPKEASRFTVWCSRGSLQAFAQLSYRWGDLVLKICTQSRTVTLNGAPIALTKLEFDILAALAAQPGFVVSNPSLMQIVWRSDWAGDVSLIYVHVCHLRKKLGETPSHPRYIHTVRGVGFRLQPDGDVDADRVFTADETGIAYDPDEDPRAVHLLVDRDRYIRWIDDKVVGLVGWAPEDLVGVRLMDLIHPDDMPEVKERQGRMNQGERTWLTLRIRAASGDYACLQVFVRPLFDLEGEISVFLGAWMPSKPLAPVTVA